LSTPLPVFIDTNFRRTKKLKINKISRRNFLAGTGALLLAGLLGGCKPDAVTTTLDKTTTATKTATETLTQVSTVTNTGAGSGNLKIIASITTVGDFVRQIGGNKVDVTIMVPPGYEPHTYEPTTGQMIEVSNAVAYVKVGSGIEFETTWMDNILAQNPDMTIIDCAPGIEIINEDPHVWNSPVNAQQMAMNIYNGLIEIDPANSEYYSANYESYIEELEELHNYITGLFEGYQNRNFLIYHPAFGYFASEYNLIQLSVEEEGKETTAQKIQECIDAAIANNLNYVFASPYETGAYAETIANEIGGSVLYLDPLPSLYIANMRSVAASISLELE
jgi:zinc transport system substrate-binding protein